MFSKINLFESITVILCLVFAITICQYHVSYDGFRGLSKEQWNIVWAIAENFFSLVMSFIIFSLAYGWLKNIFKWVFTPYFIIKTIYHFSCFAQVYLMSKNKWEIVWSWFCIFLILIGLIYLLLLFKKEKFKM